MEDRSVGVIGCDPELAAVATFVADTMKGVLSDG
jgi:hypothetical protein